MYLVKDIRLVLFIVLIVVSIIVVIKYVYGRCRYIYICDNFDNKRNTKIKIYRSDEIYDPDEVPGIDRYDPDNAKSIDPDK